MARSECTEGEIWRDIKGFEGIYQVSNRGNIRSLDRISVNSYGMPRKLKGHIMKPYLNVYGYLDIGLSNCGAGNIFKVHRLVAEAFIPNPDNLPQVNHKDENKTNNNVENLEWCTNRYNVKYSIERKKEIGTKSSIT